jgi:phosphatidylethanolamine N-methyltransferase
MQAGSSATFSWKNSLRIWNILESIGGQIFLSVYTNSLKPDFSVSRYLNNPEMMGGAAWFGLGLISGSKLVFSLAVIKHLGHWWFVSSVEKCVFLYDFWFKYSPRWNSPHMTKLYGDSLRKEAGFVKVIKNVASKNARILESRAGRHAPELKRVAREVIGTFDKVFDETADAVEEFLAKCASLVCLR